jgi:hypothetical protein
MKSKDRANIPNIACEADQDVTCKPTPKFNGRFRTSTLIANHPNREGGSLFVASLRLKDSS